MCVSSLLALAWIWMRKRLLHWPLAGHIIKRSSASVWHGQEGQLGEQMLLHLLTLTPAGKIPWIILTIVDLLWNLLDRALPWAGQSTLSKAVASHPFFSMMQVFKGGNDAAALISCWHLFAMAPPGKWSCAPAPPIIGAIVHWRL